MVYDANAAGIAVIYQELSCVDEMTVAENLFLGREPTRLGVFVDRVAAERQAAAALARFGVALDPALNQADMLHPNPAGVAVIVGRIAPAVERLLPKPTG